MDWILAAFLMFTCSAGAYLLIRRAAHSGMPIPVQNLASFLVPFLVYAVLSFTSGTPVAVNWYQGTILVVSAVLFSYLGSKWSLLGMKYAPNPGYSLVISKSYVVFTALFALIVFQSELSLRSALAIALIVAFSALVMIDPKAKPAGHVRSEWALLSVATFFCWGMLAVSSKYLLDIGVPIYTRLIWITGIVSAIILYDFKKENVKVRTWTAEHRSLFLMVGVLFAGFNYFMQLGYQLAPNIGYINAINAASIAVVTVGARIFFNDEFSARKIVGVIGVVAGLVLLVLS